MCPNFWEVRACCVSGYQNCARTITTSSTVISLHLVFAIDDASSSPPRSSCPRRMENGGRYKAEILHLQPDSTPSQPSTNTSLPSPETCIICLDLISQRATASPCQHDQFDFVCLGTWLTQQQKCPLCKTAVINVTYRPDDRGSPETVTLSASSLPSLSPKEISTRRNRHAHQRRQLRDRRIADDPALAFRRLVYAHGLLSARVGTNSKSGYRNITPQLFRQDPALIAKARRWIRRELMCFEFLRHHEGTGRSGVEGEGSAVKGHSSPIPIPPRRATNPEYLLEFIIAVLKAIDLRGSEGQAVELIGEYIGKGNARVFVHELEAWLRSPFVRVEEWDRTVQYGDHRDGGLGAM